MQFWWFFSGRVPHRVSIFVTAVQLMKPFLVVKISNCFKNIWSIENFVQNCFEKLYKMMLKAINNQKNNLHSLCNSIKLFERNTLCRYVQISQRVNTIDKPNECWNFFFLSGVITSFSINIDSKCAFRLIQWTIHCIYQWLNQMLTIQFHL